MNKVNAMKLSDILKNGNVQEAKAIKPIEIVGYITDDQCDFDDVTLSGASNCMAHGYDTIILLYTASEAVGDGFIDSRGNELDVMMVLSNDDDGKEPSIVYGYWNDGIFVAPDEA